MRRRARGMAMVAGGGAGGGGGGWWWCEGGERHRVSVAVDIVVASQCL